MNIRIILAIGTIAVGGASYGVNQYGKWMYRRGMRYGTLRAQLTENIARHEEAIDNYDLHLHDLIVMNDADDVSDERHSEINAEIKKIGVLKSQSEEAIRSLTKERDALKR